MDPITVEKFVATKGWRLRQEIEGVFGSGETLDMTLKFLLEKHRLGLVKFSDESGAHGEIFYLPRSAR